ncbi:MAG: CPBP family intramembrane metalloprotease [Lachnospiraceae bacterium]|nr:CPBP family intramembrane metalloprotease [Lachnospiraceae bacterium]
MNAKRANWAFLFMIIAYIAVAILAAFFLPAVANNILLSNLLVEVAIFIPILIPMLISREKLTDFLEFHKIKPGSVLMIGLYTFLTAPLLTLFNVISQFWVENEVISMMDSYQIANMSLLPLWLSLGVIAPVFEEVICRGAVYRSYRRSGSAFKAMILSAVVFACLHMNFNQAAYAVVMGVLAVLLVEATGSLWSSILYHGLINGSNCLLMYFSLKMDSDIFDQQAVTLDTLFYGTGLYLILAAAFAPFAFAVLVWIEKHEGREGTLGAIWRNRKWSPEPYMNKKGKMKKDKLITVPLVLALILCLLEMTGILLGAIVALLLAVRA